MSRLGLGMIVLLTTGLATAQDVDFDRDIRPILSENCVFCHGPDEGTREANLRLDDHDSALSVIEPRRSGDSELFRRLLSDDADEVMPPPGSNRILTPQQIDLVRRWIDEGATWVQHWSFRPLIAPRVSKPQGHEPTRNPIDSFVLAKLHQAGLRPSPEADRRTLIRRLALDLTGLPPTPEQVDAFLVDTSPDAYEHIVNRFLDSPAYGQRMAWDWLDVARYADTNGYQGDNERTMWPWRDWVVKAFNENLPYDEFTRWQLAGDLIAAATDEQIIATGFCRNHMINGEGGRIAEENRVEYVMDMSETMGTVWLGLTLNCCRCHDHKYDPITNKEYYQFSAFFNQTPVDGGGGNAQTPPVLVVASDQQKQSLAELNQQAATFDDQLKKLADLLDAKQSEWEQHEQQRLTGTESGEPPLSDSAKSLLLALTTSSDQRTPAQRQLLQQTHRESWPEYQRLQTRRAKLAGERDKLNDSLPKVMVMGDQPQPRQTFILTRGLYNQPTDEVTAMTPAFLPRLKSDDRSSVNRLALANWLVSPDNPLTARVTVNRIWQQFFGIGLVKTSEDFGQQGETPQHRELLDWLAAHFRGQGWNVKDLVRLIVCSRTYRQSSKFADPELHTLDPENRLFARGARFRMPAWMLRDQALAVSGLLSSVEGGPAVNTYQPPGVWEEASFGKKVYNQDIGEKLYRRSLYVFWRRIIAPTMFFDNASRQACTVKASRTNTPLHALQTLNNTIYVESARVLAERTLKAGLPDDTACIDEVFRRVLARPAAAAEHAVLRAALERTRKQYALQPTEAAKLLVVGESPRDESLDAVEHATWTGLCLAVLNIDETLNRE